jgi:hypothetical protein
MALANTGSLQTDFNVDPYYDDYDESKNFHRILFKPGLAVQARELTQLQTILQNQIDRFGEHIFKEGSVVSGNELNYDINAKFVRIQDEFSGSAVTVADFKNLEISGGTTGINAFVFDSADGSEAGLPDTKTLFIKYIDSGTDNVTTAFGTSETITSNTGSIQATTLASGATGNSAIVTLGSGIIFAKDNFIRVDEQSIVVSKYSADASLKVGYTITEEIVVFTDDNTLLDPAQGAYNYAAPGADRLKLTATLTTKELSDTADVNFVERLRLNKGRIEQKFDKPIYNVINDYIARRTYDESGDYIVNGLNVKLREHLDDENGNGGFLKVGDTPAGNDQLLIVDVNPGKAYVRGYETEVLVTEHVPIDKGIDFVQVDDATFSANYGNYVVVDELVGSWDINNHGKVDLRNTFQGAISNNVFSTAGASPLGTKIGEARVRALDHVSGSKGDKDTTYNMYLYDIQMTSNTFSQVKSIVSDDGTIDGVADVVTVSNNAVLKDSAFNTALVKVPGSYIKSLKPSGTTDTDWIFLRKFENISVTSGVFSLTSSELSADEEFTVSSFPSETQRQELFHVYVDNGSAANTTNYDTSATLSGNTVSSLTSATTKYNAGDVIQIGTDANYRFSVDNVDSTTQLTVTNKNNLSSGANNVYKVFLPGQTVSLGGFGGSTVARSGTYTDSQNIQFDLKEPTLGTTVDIIAELKKVNKGETTKTLQADKFVEIDISTNSASTSGPWILGAPDGYRLKEVRFSSSTFTSETDGTDVTSDFELDTGMKDNYYDLAKLKLKSTSTRTIGGTDFYLVKFDYFTRSAKDTFFSVDSYDGVVELEDIPIYVSPVTGESYDLRNYVDFRPYTSVSASPPNVFASKPTNPGSSLGLDTTTGGFRFIAPNESVTSSFTYNLPRKDRVIITSKGEMRVIRGVSSLNPQTPSVPSDGLTLAILDIRPNPSLPYDNAIAINREDLANEVTPVRQVRYTMRDIGVLKNRIENLEYYTSLSLLENDTKNLTISDANGLNRFKNGILVDQFTGHNIGNVKNLDYKISVDPKNNEIRPTFKNYDVTFSYNSGASGTTKTGSLVTLPYTEDKLISQPFASDNRNLTSLFYSFNGVVQLNPETDYWVDTTTSPDVQINFDFNTDAWNRLSNSWGTEWGSWSNIWSATSSSTTSNQWQVNTVATTQTGQERTGIRTTVGVPLTQEQSIGEFVKNVNVIPFMRSRVIEVVADGLKPNTRVYPFFDDTTVSSYCTPANSSFANTATEGSNLITDATGKLYTLFRIPNENGLRFRTGSLIFKLSDSVTGRENSTTFASTRYTADGLSQEVGETIISTRRPNIELQTVTENRVITNSTTRVTNISPPWQEFSETNDGDPSFDPLAQTFILNLRGTEFGSSSGAFLTKLDLFFQSKDSTSPIIVEIREVDASTSFITKRIVPFGRVVVPASSINADSSDSTVATTITFDTPVYLFNEQEYAFVVKPGGNAPNFSLWISRLGENDLATGNRIDKQPYSGILFASSNDRTYSPIQEEDVKFNAYFANFGTGSTQTAVFHNANNDFLTVNNVTGTKLTTVGEEVHGETELVLDSNIIGANVGEDLVDIVTGANGEITFTNGTGTFRLKNVTTTKFTTSNTVILFQGGVEQSSNNAVINSQTTPIGKTKLYDDLNFANTVLHLSDSNGQFDAGTWVKGQTNSGQAYIVSVDDFEVDLFHTHLSSLELEKTSLTAQAKLANSPTAAGTFKDININNDTSPESRKYILSRSNEIDEAAFLGDESVDVNVVFKNTINPYHSPAIDADRAAFFTVENLINNDSTGEDGASGGNAEARYITKTITLAEGQDAEDLKVYLTAYKSSTSDVKVYTKVLNAEDGDDFEVSNWIEMTRSSATSELSDSEDVFDYKEYEYDIPTASLTGTNGEIQYTNSQNVTYTGFKRFAIKIVLLSSNTVKPPKVKNLRVIALQI